MSFDYKKYSLENLENWVHDAMSSGEASAQEIYDTIKGVVQDNYYTYKAQTANAYELLALMNGNGKGHVKAYDEYLNKKENLVCDKEDPSPECKGAWNDFWEQSYLSGVTDTPEEAKELQLEKLKAEVRDLKAKLSRLKNPNFPHYTEEEIDALMAEKSIAKLSK
jgi:hypothetical protein